MLLTLSGPSGVGKTTLADQLYQQGAEPLVSYTTRAPRKQNLQTGKRGDLKGEYEYVSKEEFDALRTGGEFLWDIGIHENCYGTRTADIDRALRSRSKWCVAILTIDVLFKLYKHAQELKAEHRIKFFYLLLEDQEELRRRLRERGDTLKDIEQRIRDCQSWNNRIRTLPVQPVVLSAACSPASIARKVRKTIKP